MITRIQALNYRCLRYVDVALDRFHVLVGANASGKSTLFDAVSFVGDFVRDGLEKAVSRRVYNFRDLVWGRPNRDPGFEIALEVKIPEELRNGLSDGEGHHTYRYEIAVREDAAVPHVSCERAMLIAGPSMRCPERMSSGTSFPQVRQPPDTIVAENDDPGSLTILNRTLEQFSLAAEDQKSGDMSGEVPVRALWDTNLIDPLVSHLRFLDKTRFPLSLHVQSLLSAGINAMFLESTKMRRPSTARASNDFLASDGSKLPWAIKHMQETHPDLYAEWLKDVQLVLPDLNGVRVEDQPQHLARYLVLEYNGGVMVPSWVTSDGTLRLLAMMLAAYMAEDGQIILLEEAENGVHPLALEAVYQLLSSAFDAQVLVSTHSPAFLAMAEPKDVLCFATTSEGGADIMRGEHHPVLADWQTGADLDVLFASMVVE